MTLPLCPLHALTGLDCPGCGATRALAALVTGHWGEALHRNALATIGFPLLIARVMWSAWRNCVVLPARATPYLLAIATSYAILRNLT